MVATLNLSHKTMTGDVFLQLVDALLDCETPHQPRQPRHGKGPLRLEMSVSDARQRRSWTGMTLGAWIVMRGARHELLPDTGMQARDTYQLAGYFERHHEATVGAAKARSGSSKHGWQSKAYPDVLRLL